MASRKPSPIRRLTRTEIEGAAAGFTDAQPEHVLDQRLVARRQREIEALRRERAGRRRWKSQQSGTEFFPLRRYRRGATLWGRIIRCPRPRVLYVLAEDRPSRDCGEPGRLAAMRSAAESRTRDNLRRLSSPSSSWYVTRSVRLHYTLWLKFEQAQRYIREEIRGRPTRERIAAGLRRLRRLLPLGRVRDDPPLGWRCWAWDGAVLRSPHRDTPWLSEAVEACNYTDACSVRGDSGIHARRMPRGDWRLLGWPDLGHQEGCLGRGRILVTGVVERFGRAVLGETGWRAERAVIRELLAPDVAVAAALQLAYPGAIVHFVGSGAVPGESRCISERS